MNIVLTEANKLFTNAIELGTTVAFLSIIPSLKDLFDHPAFGDMTEHQSNSIKNELNVKIAQANLFGHDENHCARFVSGWNNFDIENIKQRNREDAIEGWLDGWWDLDDNFNPIAHPIIISMDVGPTLAHAMNAAGLFPSVTEARKNGFKDPIRTGLWTVGKKRIRVKIVD